MSIESLCDQITATIRRVVVTKDSAGGQDRVYTTAGRGSLPTSSRGRLQDIGNFRRNAYGMQDIQVDAVWYTVTDPQVDERDQIVVGSDLYFVHGQRNPDRLDRFWRVDLKFYRRGIQ